MQLRSLANGSPEGLWNCK